MAVPKRKISRSRRGNRRSHDALAKPGLSTCSHCMEQKRPHTICPHCGTYKGKVFNSREED